jgi:hypothetical protein
MSSTPLTPRDDWNRLKPDTVLAVEELLEQLQNGTSSQDLLDSYLYAKRLLAESMQAFMRLDLFQRCEPFHDLRRRLGDEMHRRFGDQIPGVYLTIPYGSRVHEELFSVLLQRMGKEVPGALLRVVTADSVHTERRTRELRELGIDIKAAKVNDADVYTLRSLEIDISKIPAIVKNVAKKKGYVAMPEEQLVRILSQSAQ